MKTKYKIEVSEMAYKILAKHHLGIDDQVKTLYERLEAMGENPQFAIDVFNFIKDVK